MPALGAEAASILGFLLPSMHAAQGQARGGKGRTWAAGLGSLSEQGRVKSPSAVPSSPSTVGNTVCI